MIEEDSSNNMKRPIKKNEKSNISKIKYRGESLQGLTLYGISFFCRF